MNRLTMGENVFVFLAPTLAMALMLCVYLSMRHAKQSDALRGASIFGGVLGVWLMTVYGLSANGLLSVWSALPPRVPLLVFTAIAFYVILSFTRVGRVSLSATPMWLPVLVQSFRVVVEFALWQMHREGSVPVQFTLEGRNIDMLVGLTAPLMACGIAWHWIGPKSAMIWNCLGLMLLINAMATAATSSPGPQHLDWPGEPFTAIAEWPLVWLPSFLAPTAVFLHWISMMQCFAVFGKSSDPTFVSSEQGEEKQ